jgi:hypothetical protein
MAYASITDLRRLGYIPIEDLDALDDEDPLRIPDMLEAESDEFDLYMRPRNGVPIPGATVPASLKRAVVRLVVFDLYIMRGFPSIPEGSEVAKQIIASAEWAKKLRDDIRDGRAQLAPAADATPAYNEAGVRTGYAPSAASLKSSAGSYGQVKIGNGCC